MNDLSVVDLGNGEEYFAKDFDAVHCMHGGYIGYPGGPDFMCHECEMGYDHIYTAEVFILTYLGKPFRRFYSAGDALRQFGDFLKVVAAHPGMLDTDFIDDWGFATEIEHYWGKGPA